MKIYTSYFANAKKLKQDGIFMICVAVGYPKFISGMPQMLNVAPTRYMISGNCDREEYLKRYDDILAKQSPSYVLDQIKRLSGGKDVALCCYEKPDDFCHRHILAKWLTDNTGVDIDEYGVKKAPEIKYTQLGLFD